MKLIIEYLRECFPKTLGWPEEQTSRAVARSIADSPLVPG